MSDTKLITHYRTKLYFFIPLLLAAYSQMEQCFSMKRSLKITQRFQTIFFFIGSFNVKAKETRYKNFLSFETDFY